MDLYNNYLSFYKMMIKWCNFVICKYVTLHLLVKIIVFNLYVRRIFYNNNNNNNNNNE